MADWLAAREKWRRNLMLGLSAEQVDLQALALLGARSRFDELCPGKLRQPRPRPSTRALLDASRRGRLVQLFGRQRLHHLPDVASLRILDALESAQLTLHPFDYPTLTSLMQADPARLEAAARDWLSRDTSAATPDSEADGVEVDDDGWWSLPAAVRVRTLLALRREHGERAREILTQVLSRDTAATRGKLLSVLAQGLCDQDLPLLEQASKDRAASVRTVAQRLLAQLPGTPAYAQRVEEAASALKVKRPLAGAVKVTVAVPKSFTGRRRQEWLAETFDAVDPLGLAAQLEIEPKTLCRGLDEPFLCISFALRLIASREFALAREISRRHVDRFASLMEDFGQELAALDELQGREVLTIFAAKVHGDDIRAYVDLTEALYCCLRQPLPQEVAAAVLDARALKRLHSHSDDDVEIWGFVLTRLVCVMPTTALARLHAMFASSPLALREPAVSLAQLLLAFSATPKGTAQ